MELGNTATLMNLMGNAANIGIGISQRRQGTAAIEAARAAILGKAGATAELLAQIDEQKGLVKAADTLGQQQQDVALQALIDAAQSGDPRMMTSVIPSAVSQAGRGSQQRGLITAQQMALANQPAVAAAERARDIAMGLDRMDLEMGQQAFQSGTQNIMTGAGGIMNMPMDYLALQVAAGEDLETAWESSLFEDGGYVGNTGLGIKGFGTLADILLQAQASEAASEEYLNPLDYYNREDAIADLEKMTPKERREYEIEAERELRKDKEHAHGGVIQELLQGGRMKTEGVEDHDTQEYNITDAETGELKAVTTGQEDIEVTDDGLSVTNSEQNEAIYDAFDKVKDKENPTPKELLAVYLANKKVYSNPEFQTA